jgi:phage head maturation protease
MRRGNLLNAGVVKAASIGFMPLAWDFNRQRDGIDFHETELLESSIVPVPANADCTLDAGQLKALSPDAKRRQRELEVLRLRVSP